eukprot:519203_1
MSSRYRCLSLRVAVLMVTIKYINSISISKNTTTSACIVDLGYECCDVLDTLINVDICYSEGLFDAEFIERPKVNTSDNLSITRNQSVNVSNDTNTTICNDYVLFLINDIIEKKMISSKQQIETKYNKKIRDINNTWQTTIQTYVVSHDKQMEAMNNKWQKQYSLLSDIMKKQDSKQNQRINVIDNEFKTSIVSFNNTIQKYMMPCIERMNIINNTWLNKYQVLNDKYSNMIAENDRLRMIEKKLVDDVNKLNINSQSQEKKYNSLHDEYHKLKGYNEDLNAKIIEQKKIFDNKLNSLKQSYNEQINNINNTWQTKLGACKVQLSKEEKKLTQKQNEWDAMNDKLSDKKESLETCLSEMDTLMDQKQKCEQQSTSWFG